MKSWKKVLATGIVVAVAIVIVGYKYRAYALNPWTRDGQVRALVIQITPRVSGPVVELPIRDNQRVKAGDLLFRIDPSTYQAALDQAKANLDETRDTITALEKRVEAARAAVTSAEATIKTGEVAINAYASRVLEATQEYERQKKLEADGATATRRVEEARANFQSYLDRQTTAEAQLIDFKASLAQARAQLAEAEAQLGADGEANAKLRAAKAAVRSAELDLEFTEVRAPVDGDITNLNLRLGSQAVANQPALAFVDINSFWIHGFFRETYVGRMRPGDKAVVTLMSYPDAPLTGAVDSIGRGIAQQDGSTGEDLLPNISPTFEWIRLAQRVPIRIHLTDVPEEVDLIVGTTASVLVMSGTADDSVTPKVPPAPAALQ